MWWRRELRAPSFVWVRVAPVLVILGAACAGRGGPRPETPPPLDLQGVRVMVLPAQGVRSVRGDVDAEIAFALRERGRATSWVFPPELREALARNRGVPVELDALPVGIFRQAEVRRVGDPLYGQLRRLAALSDANVAVIPIDVHVIVMGEPPAPRLVITAAAIDARLGAVLWFGAASADASATPGAPPLAAAADALARSLLR